MPSRSSSARKPRSAPKHSQAQVAATPAESLISESEAKVMEVLWQESPLFAEEISQRLSRTESWHLSTVKTLLSRLTRKAAVLAEPEGRRYLYRPLLPRSAYVASQSRSLLDRLFGGKVAPLINHFVEQKALTRRDIETLRKLLREMDHDES